MNTYRKLIINAGLTTAALLALSACGGGGGSTASIDIPVQGSISGVATKGPMNNAMVTAYGIVAGQTGGPIGTTSTDAAGNFTMKIGSYSGAVMMQVSGGSYIDEATGVSMPMGIGDVMTALLPALKAGASNSGIQVTPVTAMAQSMAQNMKGGMTDANIAAANSAMGANFSVSDILHVAPMNPLLAGSGSGASQDAQNYGMTLAAMTKYAQTMGMNSSSALVTAMMNDASDGVLDGKAGGVPVQMGGMAIAAALPASAATSGMGAAMGAFMGSGQNKSGVSTSTLMGKLTGPGAQPPIIPVNPGNPTSPAPMMNGTVSGTVFDGTVSAGTMMAFAINNGAIGAQIASTAVDAQGRFTLPLGSYAGGLMLQMSGATYVDPATRTTMTMSAGDVMTAVLSNVKAGANVSAVVVTPITSMAQMRSQAMSGGMTDANITAANAAMGNYFMVGDILNTQPLNPSVVGAAASATPASQNYGMVLAAMSQSAKTLNMTNSSAFATAMMKDVADGVIDGKIAGSQISMSMGKAMGSNVMGTSPMASSAGTSSLATAMLDFMNSAANTSGLTVADMAALWQKLNIATGQT